MSVSSTGSAMPLELDCLGQLCPLPIIALARRITDVPVGAAVVVLADDPAATVDIPAWCEMRGQEYVSGEASGGMTRYVIRRLR